MNYFINVTCGHGNLSTECGRCRHLAMLTNNDTRDAWIRLIRTKEEQFHQYYGPVWPAPPKGEGDGSTQD